MRRESDIIDVWFESGSMPYAQIHYPFENKDLIDKQINFPADFIAEGVDQTRGWFYTLHAISCLSFNSISYKNVVSNGLVLDKNGQKMSKRLGNAVDPFEMIDKYLNFNNLFSLVTLVPSISLSVRRLHDINRSGWWFLLSITLIGLIPLIYWACQRGDRVENDYGSDKEAGRDS